MDKRVLCGVALLPGLIFTSMQSQQSITPDAKAAVDEITALFTPNPDAKGAIAKTSLTTGTWGVTLKTATDSEATPLACDEKISPCAKVVYRVQEPPVQCSWIVRFVQGKVTHADGTIFDGVHPEVVGEDENAARYTLRKSWMEGETSPQETSREEPPYPPIAQAAHVEGDVIVQVVVGPDGKVTAAAVQSGPPMLAMAALESAKRWKFTPETVGGRPITFRVSLSFVFRNGGSFMPGVKGQGRMNFSIVRVGPHA